jgi:hypothetical protein
MKLSSKLTYILPFLMLMLPSYLIGALIFARLHFAFQFNVNEDVYTLLSIVCVLVIAALFYLSFLKLSSKVKPVIFKIILVIIPIIAVGLFGNGEFPIFLSFLPGLVLMYAFTLFDTRYTATLTGKSIHYKNLLGHQGEIPLVYITCLEQKKNILGFLSRYGKLLDVARKTSIGFRNENLDEFEITLFVRAFHHDEVFNKIIDSTNKEGNLKVRQYSF